MIIKLVRHGESQDNAGERAGFQVGDHSIDLTERGRQQALQVGQSIGHDFLEQAIIYCSPYQRTRSTLHQILCGAGVPNSEITIYEDPRLREVDLGYRDPAEQQEQRRTHGWFYYRYAGGESAADCYDRTSSFLESLMRQLERRPAKHVLIVSHGLTIRSFVMRFLHLTVEQYEQMQNPGNGDIITLAPRERIAIPQFSTKHWGVDGLKLR